MSHSIDSTVPRPGSLWIPDLKLKSEHDHKIKCLVRYNRKSFYTLSLQKSSNYAQLFHKRFHCEPMVNRLQLGLKLGDFQYHINMGSFLDMSIRKDTENCQKSKFFDQTSQKRPESCRHVLLIRGKD